jgi:hypothetical protein
MRLFSAAIFTVVIACGTADAGWKEFWHSVDTDWHRNNCWPEPFYRADRVAEKAPWGTMVSKGWQVQNTLGAYHFNPETGELTSAGRLKVHYILVNSPAERRTIFVARSGHEKDNLRRVDAVQQLVSTRVMEGPLPQVVQTEIDPEGWPAERADAINRQVRSTMMDPVLPVMELTTGGN